MDQYRERKVVIPDEPNQKRLLVCSRCGNPTREWVICYLAPFKGLELCPGCIDAVKCAKSVGPSELKGAANEKTI